MMSDRELAKRSCVSCRADTLTLSEDKIEEYLLLIPGWARNKNCIEKSFAFPNFAKALTFFFIIASEAETEGHHPDMGIYEWRNVHFSLTTHAVHGLTENDFVMAAKINALNV